MPYDSVVGEIAKMLLEADVINFFAGDAQNRAHNDVAFKQIGIVEREAILKLIVEKLDEKGKIIRVIKPDMLF